ncbi:MAG: hypothetical protein ACOC1X_00315 [Promethearchaeota archaeon]
MSKLEILLMKCDNCNQHVFSLIKLKEKRKSERMKASYEYRNLRKVCLKCAVKLNHTTKHTKKPLYNFGEYWKNMLDNHHTVYFNEYNQCKR